MNQNDVILLLCWSIINVDEMISFSGGYHVTAHNLDPLSFVLPSFLLFFILFVTPTGVLLVSLLIINHSERN